MTCPLSTHDCGCGVAFFGNAAFHLDVHRVFPGRVHRRALHARLLLDVARRTGRDALVALFIASRLWTSSLAFETRSDEPPGRFGSQRVLDLRERALRCGRPTPSEDAVSGGHPADWQNHVRGSS